jgi:NTE family protein
MGEHELTIELADRVSLARVVAASSAFPPVFPPLRLDHDAYRGKGTVEYVTLTDGGVYDNLGINPLLAERNALDYIIVSDGGAPFQLDDTPADSGAGVVAALIPLMMEQIRGLQFDRIQFRHKAKAGPKPLWFSIDSPLGQVNPGDAELASRVGTNLKALSSGEMSLLTRHGAALVEHRLTTYASELLGQV